MPIRFRTIWPALMFAARRNDKVIGRTRTLDVSIKIKNGLSQSGAPSGRKCAVLFLGCLVIEDEMNLSHIGRPSDKVKIRCLDRLKAYGLRPIRLI